MRLALTAAATALVLTLGCKSDRHSPLVDEAHAGTHDAELSRAIPIFSVRDLRASQAYFRDVLGFKLNWEDGDPPDFGSVGRGDATIFLCQGCQGKPGGWIFVFTRDVDGLYREFTRKRALIKMPPTDMPWNLREMQVADRDGNVIRFASETEH